MILSRLTKLGSKSPVMTIYRWLIGALWLILIVYWAVSAIGAKRSIGARFWWREAGLRLGIILLILLALRVPALRGALQNVRAYGAGTGVLMGVIGVVFCALGVGLAVWSRAALGKNWGMPMSRKESPELVTTGPYAVVRHPIYVGIILAMVGSSIAESILWLAPLALLGPYFIYSAWREDKLMMASFPEQYPAYKSRTKMLIPFIV